MQASATIRSDPDQAFAAFHARVLADDALQAALGAIQDPAVFAAHAARAARDWGLALEAGDVRARLHSVAGPLPVFVGLEPPAGWLPAEVMQDEAGPLVTWTWLGQRRLTEPFYEDSLAQARHQPFNRLFGFRTPLAELENGPADRRPDGLIFHMSRCGSTLAAQMLAASPADVVVSEARPLDAIVRLEGVDEAARIGLLRAMAAVLLRPRNPGETRGFLKLDCWHTLDLPLFRRAFPDTPWVFLYRDPVEVLVSHLRRRGIQMIPEFVPARVFGIDLPGGVPDEDYCARVLAAVCDGAARHYPKGGGRLVDYRQMPDALFTTILPHFGVTPTPGDAEEMRAAGLRNAKAPDEAFAPDAQDKQRAAGDAVRAICERRLGEIHRRLEALRAAQT